MLIQERSELLGVIDGLLIILGRARDASWAEQGMPIVLRPRWGRLGCVMTVRDEGTPGRMVSQ